MADYAIHDTTLEAIADTIRKKDGTSALIDPADYSDRINLMGMLEEKTQASSPIADFSDGADDVPTKSLVVTIPPTLSGVSSVTENRNGGNFIELYTRSSHNGVDYSINADGSLHRYGTASGNSFNNENATNYNNCPYKLHAGTYTLSVDGNINNNTFVSLGIFLKSGASFTSQGVTGVGSVTFTVSEDFGAWYYCKLNNGVTVNDDVYIWLYAGSTAHAYEPYTTPTQYTASLGRTIYGGTADIVNGTGTDGYAKDSMTSTYLSGLSSSYIGYEASTNYFGGHPTIWVRNWNYQTAKIRQAGGIGCVCNYFPVSMHNTDIINTQNRIYFDVNGKGISDVSGFITFVQNLEANNESLDIVYELNDTYTTDFTFDGQEINTRLGYNAFWSDEGDTEVTYRASGTIYNYPRGEEASF